MSKDTHAYFLEHPELVAGRCLDKWVAEQREKETGEVEDRFATKLAALETGTCRCGRHIYPSRRLQKEVCPGCMGEPPSCACVPTRDLREKYFLEWQRDREKSGVPPSSFEMDEKRTELKLDDREARAKAWEKAAEADRRIREEQTRADSEQRKKERDALMAAADATPEVRAEQIAALRAESGGSMYQNPPTVPKKRRTKA